MNNESDRKRERSGGTSRIVPIQPAEIDKTVPMDADALNHTMPLDTDCTKVIETPDRKAAEPRKESFFTDSFPIFDKGRDVEQVIRDRKGKLEHGDVEKEAYTGAAMSDLDRDFEIRKSFAEGGQGVLSEGRDLHLKRLVAIKSLKPALCEDTRQRGDFIAEAQVTAQLEHPSIVPIYSIHGDGGNGLHLAMKMVHGQNFKDYLTQICTHYKIDGIRTYDERKSLRYRLDVFLKICDALEYAHSRNIMHCDLKPENIMIGEYHEAYLMDWGIARPIREPGFDPEKWLPPKRIIGTPRFLTPEAIRGEHTDQRADIYAMGLILYEVATLTEAYDGSTVDEIAAKIRKHDMNPVEHRFGFPIDADLKAIILKAAAFDRGNRYDAIRELAADVRKYLRGEEVSANPDHFLRKILRWGRLHTKAILIIALAGLLATAATSAFSLAREVTRERQGFIRSTALSHAYIRCSDTVYKFDRQIALLEETLDAAARETMFLLNSNTDAADAVPPVPASDYADPKTAPEDCRYAPAYQADVDFDHLVMKPLNGKFSPGDAERAARVSLLRPRFYRAFLESRFGTRLTDENKRALHHTMTQDGVPLMYIYFGFENGLFVSYPGSHFKDDYDPRTRVWYKDRVSGDTRPGWGKPYFEVVSNRGLVLTCSMPMQDAKGNLLGVAGIDISIQKIMDALKESGTHGGAILEKTFFDEDGSIIATTNQELFARAIAGYKTAKDGGGTAFHYPDKNLSAQIRELKNGILSDSDDNGREVVYVFTKCQAVDWYYFEKLDLQILLEQYKNVVTEKEED